MATPKSSLIYIPDISGFTKFVTETEINHSTHIIEELLEIIIDANEINLEVSEIEGDAVLFYRFGTAPSVREVVKQSKDMFIRFHEHLKLYERDRVCPCGACSTAQNLSLKMVAHYGELSEVKVRERSKLLGEDMIIAHRLLKNDISNDEYLLLSGKYLNSCSEADLSDETWVEMKEGSSSYDEIGSVDYCYTILSPLRGMLKNPPARPSFERSANSIVFERIVNAPIKWVHEVISNPKYKPKIAGIEVETDESEMPRIGTVHKCIVPSGTLYFETIKSQLEAGHMEYGERGSNFPVIGEADFLNIMDSVDENTTKVKFEVHFRPQTLLAKVKVGVFKHLVKYQAISGFKKLKEFIETNEPAY